MATSSLPRLDGRVAIVTGASRGIGRNMALALAEAGCAVVVAARSVEENPQLPGTIHSVAARIEAAGGRALAVPCDVTSEDSVAATVTATLERFARIDCLIANAGVMWLARTADTPLKRWELVLRVNLTGTFLFTRAVLPVMREQRRGSLIAITTNGVLMTDAAQGGGSNAYWVSVLCGRRSGPSPVDATSDKVASCEIGPLELLSARRQHRQQDRRRHRTAAADRVADGAVRLRAVCSAA